MGSAVETLCGQAYGAQKYELLGLYAQRSTILLTFAYIVVSPRCRETWAGFSVKAFLNLGAFAKLSAASAVMLCLEIWYYQILVLFAGLLENAEIALASLAICTTISGWVFMVSVGFNAAVSVRVSNEIGARHPRSASFAVWASTITSFLIATVLAVVVMSLRHVISYAFTGGTTVATAVSELCPFLAISILLNGVQPVLSGKLGVAVGCGWQAFVAYVNVGCYYLIGIPLGCIMGFKFDMGVKGLWSGMIGGTLMQTLILLWVTYRTDWNIEVKKARNRLQKWETDGMQASQITPNE
ncbi:Protein DETOXIFICATION 40 [Linum perenne]